MYKRHLESRKSTLFTFFVSVINFPFIHNASMYYPRATVRLQEAHEVNKHTSNDAFQDQFRKDMGVNGLVS
jgi:hypothetical protein